LSGIMFPLENMPGPMLVFAYLNPLKYFVVLLRNIMLKGGDPSVVWSNIGALVLMGTVMITIAFKRFKPTLN
jgi:ABC-2 type transport system permease protein